MKSVTLSFPKGLQARLINLLQPIKFSVSSARGFTVTAEFIGVLDNWKSLLNGTDYINHIEIA